MGFRFSCDSIINFVPADIWPSLPRVPQYEMTSPWSMSGYPFPAELRMIDTAPILSRPEIPASISPCAPSRIAVICKGNHWPLRSSLWPRAILSFLNLKVWSSLREVLAPSPVLMPRSKFGSKSPRSQRMRIASQSSLMSQGTVLSRLLTMAGRPVS